VTSSPVVPYVVEQQVSVGAAHLAWILGSDPGVCCGRPSAFVRRGCYMQRDPQGIMVHKDSPYPLSLTSTAILSPSSRVHLVAYLVNANH